MPSRVIHTAQALVDVVVAVPTLPRRGANVMATGHDRYAAGAVNILLAAARSGAECVHAGAHGEGPNGDLVREALTREGVTLSAPMTPGEDTGICVVLLEASAERTFVTTQMAEREITVESLAASAPVAGDLVCVSGYSLVGRTRDPLLAWLAGLDPEVVVILDPGAIFAELERAPEHIHTYRVTRLGLWNARAAGHDAEQVMDVLERYSRFPVPQPLLIDIAETMDRYGRLTLRKDDEGRLILVTTDRAVLTEILRHKKIQPLLGERVDDDTVLVHPSERGTLKQELLKVGWPAEDEADLPRVPLDERTVDVAAATIRLYLADDPT